MKNKEQDKLDAELLGLERDVQFDVNAIVNDSTVTNTGKYIPNSKLAKQAAKKMKRISQILAIYEQAE